MGGDNSNFMLAWWCKLHFLIFLDREFEDQGQLMEIVQGLAEGDESYLEQFKAELRRKEENVDHNEPMDFNETRSTIPTK